MGNSFTELGTGIGRDENGDGNSRMQEDVKSNVKHQSVAQKNQGKKIKQKQTSLLDYFTPRNDTADEHVEMKHGSEIMVNVQKLINQLTSARVILKRLPDSLLIRNNKSNRRCFLMEIKRYCPKCKVIVKITKNRYGKKCKQCDSYLLFECAKCAVRYSSLPRLQYHLKTKCFCCTSYTCTKCEYSSPIKGLLDQHIKFVHAVHINRKKLRAFRCLNCKGNFSYRWEYLKHATVCKDN